jgi:hypothetical protein
MSDPRALVLAAKGLGLLAGLLTLLALYALARATRRAPIFAAGRRCCSRWPAIPHCGPPRGWKPRCTRC